MTIPTSKQKKIITLAQQGLSIPEIAKETKTSYKTAKKYAGISTTPQPQIPAPQQSVIDGCSPKFATPKQKRARDTTRSYAGYENVPYYRPVRIARPSFRVAEPRPPDGLDEPAHESPVAQAPSENKYVKLFNEVHNQKGIDTRPIIRYLAEQKERKQNRQRMAEQKAEDDKKMQDMTEKLTRQIANDREHAKAVADLQLTLIENRKVRDRENYELDFALEQKALTKEQFRNIFKEVAETNKEDQEKISIAYEGLANILHGEEIRLKKRDIDIKFIADIMPSGWVFLNDILKSIVVLRNRPKSKPKIVKVQLVKKPMQARVIK